MFLQRGTSDRPRSSLWKLTKKERPLSLPEPWVTMPIRQGVASGRFAFQADFNKAKDALQQEYQHRLDALEKQLEAKDQPDVPAVGLVSHFSHAHLQSLAFRTRRRPSHLAGWRKPSKPKTRSCSSRHIALALHKAVGPPCALRLPVQATCKCMQEQEWQDRVASLNQSHAAEMGEREYLHKEKDLLSELQATGCYCIAACPLRRKMSCTR